MSTEASFATDRTDGRTDVGSLFTRFTLGKAYVTLLGSQLLVIFAMWVFLWPRAVGLDLAGSQLLATVAGLLILASGGFYVSLYRLFVGMAHPE